PANTHYDAHRGAELSAPRPDRSPLPSDRCFAGFPGAHPDHGFHRGHPNLPVPDAAGPGRADDLRHHVVQHRVRHQDFDPELLDEVHGVLGTPVDLGVPLLAPVALGLADRHAQHPELAERRFDVVQFRRLDDRGHQLHTRLPSSSTSFFSARSAVLRTKRSSVKLYALSACSASSMPWSSASAVIRKPTVPRTSSASSKLTTKE